jgi:GNAT superfamily N-acetyltransferase
MTGPALRPATHADIPHFARIDAATEPMFVAAGHPEFAGGGTIGDADAANAIDEGRMFVAVVAGEAAGEVVGWLLESRMGADWCVAQLSVDPNHQRTGIGGQLLSATIDRARAAGEPRIVLNTQSDVPWNRAWYERFGFEVLEPSAWTDAMRQVTAEQTGAGLDWGTRVHMSLAFPTSPAESL